MIVAACRAGLAILLAVLILAGPQAPASAQSPTATPTATATPTLAPIPTPTVYATPTAEIILPDLLTITSAADVAARRAALRGHIWPGGYPETRAFDQYLGVNDPALLAQIDAANVANVHRYRVQQAYGIDVDMWLWQAKNPVGVSLLYHSGHDFTPISDATRVLIPRLMKAGVDVLVVGMILTPANPDPVWNGFPIIDHSSPWALPRPNNRHPLHFFLEPAIAGLNALRAVYPSRPVHMAGLSGGGWTVTMLAALDTRIVKSFNVAGSMPFDVWQDGSVSPAWGKTRRDPEQGSGHLLHTDTYAIAGYRDLYVMGSHGAGRSQLQILHEFDECCFWAHGADLSYARQVQKRVLDIGDGSWRLWIDTGQSVHTVSLHATNEIIRELGLPPVGGP